MDRSLTRTMTPRQGNRRILNKGKGTAKSFFDGNLSYAQDGPFGMGNTSLLMSPGRNDILVKPLSSIKKL